MTLILCFQCLERTSLNEETIVHMYNAAALLAERLADADIPADKKINAERLFEGVEVFWSKLKEHEGMMRCVIRSHIRMVSYFLKTSRTSFPDLGYVQR